MTGFAHGPAVPVLDGPGETLTACITSYSGTTPPVVALVAATIYGPALSWYLTPDNAIALAEQLTAAADAAHDLAETQPTTKE
ncbi:hypothetical protein U8D42_03990 [Mycobacterium europaeum]|uniref:DUF6907 domain-containing protein n=1 Tax=Mycobacterium europaeum TaxID=761804 RepID=UPI002ADFA2A7|nr:hypothetical protein [Mycobacterium europaeum]MEA1159279.1 hypothetical protein [Mycobacterium europaeum]